MRFLIDDLDGKTIEADMIDDMLESFNADDVLYVDGIPCRLSTARSLEAEAVKEARAIIQKLLDVEGWSIAAEWLDKWGRE